MFGSVMSVLMFIRSMTHGTPNTGCSMKAARGPALFAPRCLQFMLLPSQYRKFLLKIEAVHSFEAPKKIPACPTTLMNGPLQESNQKPHVETYLILWTSFLSRLLFSIIKTLIRRTRTTRLNYEMYDIKIRE